MVRKLSPLGHYYHEPPYTEDEILEHARRTAEGPKTIRKPSRRPQRRTDRTD